MRLFLGAVVLLASCTAGPIDLAENGLLRGLVAHWSFDETAGNIVADSSGHGHHGTLTGGAWIPGHFQGALHLEPGAGVAVNGFPQATTNWTVGLWARPPTDDFGDMYVTLLSTELVFAGGWEMNARLSATSNLYQFGYYLGPGDSDYFKYDCECAVRQQWTHLLAVVNGVSGTLTFYRDGLLQLPVASPPPPLVPAPIKTGSGTLYMGRWYMDGRLFKGDLDDVVIYDRALTAAEVATLARGAAPPVP